MRSKSCCDWAMPRSTNPVKNDYLYTVSALSRSMSIPVLLVGGAVRDVLLDLPPGDFDFAVAGNAIKLARACADQLDAALFVMDAERGVARVIKKDPEGAQIFDFARRRGESWLDDLSDRDFTINAIGFDIDQRAYVDPLGGRADLIARVLRPVSDTAIQADPVRAIRGIRMAHQFGLQIDPNTENLLRAAVPVLKQVSPERLRDALCDILALPAPASAVRDLLRLGLLSAIMPDVEGASASQTVQILDALFWLDNAPSRLGLALNTETQSKLAQYLRRVLTDDRTLRTLLLLAVLVHASFRELNGKLSAQLTTLLRLSVDETAYLRNVIAAMSRIDSFLATEMLHRLTEADDIYQVMKVGGQAVPSSILFAGARVLARQSPTTGIATDNNLAVNTALSQLIEVYFDRYAPESAPAPLLSGQDILALGLKPGPAVGAILERVRQAQMTDQLTTRAEAIDYATRLIAARDVSSTILGPTLPDLVRRLNLPLNQTAPMFSLLSIGYFLSGPLYATFVNRVNPRLWLAAPLVPALSLVGFASVNSLSGLFVCAFFLGAGQSLTQVAYLSWLGTRTRGDANASAILNRVNAFYGLGSLIGPLLVALGSRFQWPTLAFWCAAAISIVLFALGTLAPADEAMTHNTESVREQPFSMVMKSGVLLGMILTMAIYVGAEVTLSGYLASFASRLPDVAAWQAPFSTSLFFGGLALSRYFSSSFFKNSDEVRAVFVMLGIALLGLSVCLFFPTYWAALLGATVIGIGLGPMYPTLISIGIQRFPTAPRLVSSLLTSCGSFGSVSIPWLTGVLLDQPGGATLAWNLQIALVLLAGAIWFLVARLTRRTATG
jgi:tRNA nucleotidyltransferase/poly(A) polymerase/fucose permease